MKPSRCLLLCSSGHGATSLVQALGRSGFATDVMLLGASTDPDSRFAAKVFRPESAKTLGELAACAENLDTAQPYDLVLAASDVWVASINTLPAAHPLRLKAALAPAASINTALSHTEIAKVARAAGLDVVDPRIVPKGTIPEPPYPFPFVMRSTSAVIVTGNDVFPQKPFLCGGYAAYEDYLENRGMYQDADILQATINRRLHVLCVCQTGELRIAFASEPLHEQWPGGPASLSRSVACDRNVLDAARTLLKALDWHGAATLEFGWQEGGPITLIGMRTGWEELAAHAIAAGVNLPLVLYSLSASDAVLHSADYCAGVYLRNLEDDLEWFRSGRAGFVASEPDASSHGIASSVKRILSGEETWEGFSLSDPTPGLRTVGRLVFRAWKSLLRGVESPLQLRWMRSRHRRNVKRFTSKSGASGRIMFVCHGNICRSPLAEYLCKSRLPRWRIHSTGLHAAAGSRSPGRIRRIALGLGADLELHRSAHIDQHSVREADLILIMDALNYRDFTARFPEAVDKLFLLGMFGTNPSLAIADPVNMDPETAQASARQLADAVDGLVRWLVAKTTP